MINIALYNGQNVIIGSNRDVVEVIEEYLSHELASYLNDSLSSLDSQIEGLEVSIGLIEKECQDYEEEILGLRKENDLLEKKIQVLEGGIYGN